MNKEIISRLETRIKELKNLREDLVEPLDFYSTILSAYEEFGSGEWGKPFEVPAAAAKGPFPFIDIANAELGWDAALPLFRGMLAVFIESVETQPDVDQAADAGDADILRRAFRAFVFVEKGALHDPASGISPQLAFIAFLSMRPCIDSLVADARKLLDPENGVYENTCPVCGGLPVMTELVEEEGFRFLVCGVCESSWLYKRMKCPFCGNEEPKTIGYLIAEGAGLEDCYTAATCEKCRQYLKSLDTRKKDFSVDVVLEAIATAHWDLIAQKENYRPASAWYSADNSN